MSLKDKNIGYAVTGSHCTIAQSLEQVYKLKEIGANIFPIFSESVQYTDTRFGKASEWKKKFEEATGNAVVTSIVNAEPIGPNSYLDCIVIAPCTGNTASKLSAGITDGTVLMAAKAQLRNLKPVVLAIATNDGLANCAKNIGILLNYKNIYFVPFGQDDPIKKPNSLVSDMNLIYETIIMALEGKQTQPILKR